MSKIRGMRGFLASSIVVTCAAALALPLTPPAAASNVPAMAAARPAPTAEAPAPGSTRSLALAPLTSRDRTLAPTSEHGLTRRDVSHFSLVGVVWDNPDVELHGRVQVRTRAAGTSTWSGWQEIETHADHAADPDTAERTSGRVRGATAPLWVGDSDGVEVRVRAEAGTQSPRVEETARGPRTATTASPLPSGMRLELVDPGEAPGEAPAEEPPSREAPATGTPRARTLAPTAEPVQALAAVDASALRGAELTQDQRVKPKIGPRPRIVTRRGWGADENLREKGFVYSKKVKAAFVHHTASGNGYRCAQAPSLIRGIYRYHVMSMGWRDIGYNFLVDKCGNIYEGRAGGVAKPVLGAHTLGFNTNSAGIAVLGSYSTTKPSAAAVKAIARLTAWKLGLHGANPRGKTYLRSAGGLYYKGKNVRLNVISGHRDGFPTVCPGWQLYRKLGTARLTAARYQGR